MRCPDCNKFVGWGDKEVEANDDPDINGNTVTVDVTVGLTCSDCGQRLKEASIPAEADIVHECPNADGKPAQFEFEEADEPTETERCEGKGRGLKTYYGFTQDVKVKCVHCEAIIDVTLEGDEQASAFDECV